MKKKYVVCAKCGKEDRPRKPTFDVDNAQIVEYNTGTSTVMKCRDCGGDSHDKHALRCRACCPTGHGTRLDETPDFRVRPKSEIRRETIEKYGTREDI